MAYVNSIHNPPTWEEKAEIYANIISDPKTRAAVRSQAQKALRGLGQMLAAKKTGRDYPQAWQQANIAAMHLASTRSGTVMDGRKVALEIGLALDS